jgi:hypothetical protein
MMPNPYLPGRPAENGRQFFDQHQVMGEIRRCLDKGKSCAIIGGVGMGKTSILKHIRWRLSLEEDLLQRQLAEAREDLHFIQERNAKFVLSTDIPLQFVKEERRCLDRIAKLEEQLAAHLAEDDISSEPAQFRANNGPFTVFPFIPIYFQSDLRRLGLAKDIYQHLLDVTIAQTQDWLGRNRAADRPEVGEVVKKLPLISLRLPGSVDREAAFELALRDIIGAVHPVAYANTKFLFLLDDVFCIENKDEQRAFVKYWLQLLDNERDELLSSNIAIIITCLKHFLDQFGLRKRDAAMGLPVGYDAVESIDLEVFKQQDSCEVVYLPFKDTLNLDLTGEVAAEIHDLTGGHPHLLQSAMSDLWIDAAMRGEQIDPAYVQNHETDWRRECSEIYRWIQEMVDSNRDENPVLGTVLSLLVTEDRIWKQTTLAKTLKKHPGDSWSRHRLRDALQALKSWGVVCEVGNDEYRVSGRLCQEWFRGQI